MEVQENSDVTYRVYDYGRLQNEKPRPLHIDQSMEVILTPNELGSDELIHAENEPNKEQLLADTQDFVITSLKVEGEYHVDHTEKFFCLVSVTEGSGRVGSLSVKKGDNLMIPAGYGECCFCGDMHMIITQPVSL